MTTAADPGRSPPSAEIPGFPGGASADALLVSDSLVTADLWGHPSHGVLRLPWYAARLSSGVMSAVTAPEFVADAGAVAVMDAHDGVGQVVIDRACTRLSHVPKRTASASWLSATPTTSVPPPTGPEGWPRPDASGF